MAGQQAAFLPLAVEPAAFERTGVIIITLIAPAPREPTGELAVQADALTEEYLLPVAAHAPNAAQRTGVRALAIDPATIKLTEAIILPHPAAGQKAAGKCPGSSYAADDGHLM